MPPDELIVITGGGGGIGAAAARHVLTRWPGTAVALLDVSRGEVDAIIGESDGRATFFACDVTEPRDVASVFERVDALDLPISGLVNCAGNVNKSHSAELDFGAWSDVLAVHLNGTFLCSQAAGRRMLSRRRGAIVNIGSIAAVFGHPRRLPYSVAKAGILQMTRTLAVEWARDGVRVNAVAPGYVETPMMEEVARLKLIDADAAAAMHAMGRLGTPDEIARAIGFLLSDDASFITGATLMVDGGFSVLKTT